MNPKQIRETAGFTVAEMAHRLGVTTQRVYAMEAAKDWMVSTILDCYRACIGPGELSGSTLVLASKCLTGSLERWSRGEGPRSVIQMDFQHLCDSWRQVFEVDRPERGEGEQMEDVERRLIAMFEDRCGELSTPVQIMGALLDRVDAAEALVAELEARTTIPEMDTAPTDGDVVALVAMARWDQDTAAWWRGPTIGWLPLPEQRGEGGS